MTSVESDARPIGAFITRDGLSQSGPVSRREVKELPVLVTTGDGRIQPDNDLDAAAVSLDRSQQKAATLLGRLLLRLRILEDQFTEPSE